jgi:hypothetical protein
MSLTSAGLSNLQGLGVGQTTNFIVQIENTLPNQANVIANADALLAVLETEFTVTTGWFNTPSGKFGAGHQQVVNLNLPDTATGGGSISEPGANNNGYGNPINLDSQNLVTGALAAGRVEDVFMAEWSEVLMSLTGTWNAGDSSGEGLSQFTSIIRFQTGHYNYYGSFVDAWLNGGQAWSSNNLKYVASPNAARSDWVTQTFTGITTSAGDQIHGDGGVTRPLWMARATRKNSFQ